MERYYFCNFLGNKMDRACNKGVTEVVVSEKLSENVQMAKAYIEGEGSKLSLKFVSEDDICNGLEFDFIGSYNTEDKRVKSTYEELKHTEENPIILVATKKFKVYNGIPTYVKYIPVKEGVLIALIKGYISVMGSDGDMIPLSRNCKSLSNEVGHVFDAESIRKLNSLSDKESGVLYSDYVVNDCIITIETTKDGRNINNLKFSRNHFSYLYKEVFDKAKAEKEEKKRKALEIKKLNEERTARFMEDQKAKQKELEEEKKSEKAKRPANQKKKNENVQTGFEGAKSFLAFVESVKSGQK